MRLGDNLEISSTSRLPSIQCSYYLISTDLYRETEIQESKGVLARRILSIARNITE